MTIKKFGFVSIVLGVMALGASLQAYANDSVTFYMEAPSHRTLYDSSLIPVLTYTFELQTDDGLLARAGQAKLQFGPHTNVFDKSEIIPETSPQVQTGNVTLIQHGSDGTSFVRCTASWEHLFWKSKEKESSTHDRFIVRIISQYQEGACFAHNFYGVNKSGQTAWIVW